MANIIKPIFTPTEITLLNKGLANVPLYASANQLMADVHMATYGEIENISANSHLDYLKSIDPAPRHSGLALKVEPFTRAFIETVHDSMHSPSSMDTIRQCLWNAREDETVIAARDVRSKTNGRNTAIKKGLQRLSAHRDELFVQMTFGQEGYENFGPLNGAQSRMMNRGVHQIMRSYGLTSYATWLDYLNGEGFKFHLAMTFDSAIRPESHYRRMRDLWFDTCKRASADIVPTMDITDAAFSDLAPTLDLWSKQVRLLSPDLPAQTRIFGFSR